jgi:glycosyltransferase involved in cell wall biosynthesis
MTKQFFWLSFLPFEQVHLRKEAGKIPEFIGRETDWAISIIRPNVDSIGNLDQEIPHVKLISCKSRKIWIIDLGLLFHLIRYARSIDILLVYHFDINTFLSGFFYKTINPAGFLWNKLDLDEGSIRNIEPVNRKRNLISRFVHSKLSQIHIKVTDLISTESMGSLSCFQASFPLLEKKIIYMPTGLDISSLHEKKNIFREQIILNVGRLGTFQKGTDLLLEAFAQSGVWTEWKLVLIGKVESSFSTYIHDFQEKHPELWKSIEWIGQIESKEDLADWYQRAKIFCFSSRYESFGLALAEAAYYGCACISSDFASAYEILDNGNCGVFFHVEDIADLVMKLKQLCNNQDQIEDLGMKAQKHIRENFNFEIIIKKWVHEYQIRRK